MLTALNSALCAAAHSDAGLWWCCGLEMTLFASRGVQHSGASCDERRASTGCDADIFIKHMYEEYQESDYPAYVLTASDSSSFGRCFRLNLCS
jgi:hypothetical protein